MKANFLVIPILAAAVLTQNSFGEETTITELPGDFTGSFGKRPWPGKVQVHRITSPAAFKRMIDDRASPVDFSKRDVVIVRGSLGCAHGKVVHSAKKSVAAFRIKITERCTHRTRILHHFPFSAAFAVDKSVSVAPHLPIGRGRAVQPRGDPTAKLGDPDATHVNLSGFKLTEDDLAKLKAFKNVTHLYLSSTQITDKGLTNVAHMDKLYQLFLGGNAGITDAGLKHLSGTMTSRIQIIDVTGTAITHEGLETLRKWSKQQDNQHSTQISHSLITPQVHN
jgi:hypothetical protein